MCAFLGNQEMFENSMYAHIFKFENFQFYKSLGMYWKFVVSQSLTNMKTRHSTRLEYAMEICSFPVLQMLGKS